MKYYYALMDTKASVFSAPFVEWTDGSAIRLLEQAVKDPETAVGRHPEDYTLFCVGSWDEQDGILEGHTPRSIVNAAQLVQKSDGEMPLFRKE